MPAGRAEGRFRSGFTEGRFADAQRCVREAVAEGFGRGGVEG